MYNKKNSVTAFAVTFYFAHKKALGQKARFKIWHGLDFQIKTGAYVSEDLIKSNISVYN